MGDEEAIDSTLHTSLVSRLQASLVQVLKEKSDCTDAKALVTTQCSSIKSFLEHINCIVLDENDSDGQDLKLKVLLQSKQILIESKFDTIQHMLRVLQDTLPRQAIKPHKGVAQPMNDENAINFATSAPKQPAKKRKREGLAVQASSAEITLREKQPRADVYRGARVFMFEHSDEDDASPAKRARVDSAQGSEGRCEDELVIRGHDDTSPDLFALDATEQRPLVSSRECAIEVDLSQFNFERLEEKSSQPEHISSQPGRSMDVRKKLEQIEMYLSETSEPQDSEREELPALLAYQLSQTDYAELVKEDLSPANDED